MWVFNRERFADRELRNADQLYVYLRIDLVLLKECLYSIFPAFWNAEGLDKFNPIPHRYVKNSKKCSELKYMYVYAFSLFPLYKKL
jgi:hypothetical protein